VHFALLPQSDRQPSWPASLVGSITHTAGLCAAVAARRTSFAGLGVDSEVVGEVSPELWPKICATREIAWLRTLPAAEQAPAATLIFAAKEAFYKCQYPVTGEFLDFHDVLFDAPEWGAQAGVFTVRAARDLKIAQVTALPFACRFRFHEGYVSAAAALPAAASAADGSAADGSAADGSSAAAQ
jgi:4'-phosphopantetheinyl transferase EntD